MPLPEVAEIAQVGIGMVPVLAGAVIAVVAGKASGKEAAGFAGLELHRTFLLLVHIANTANLGQ